MMRFGKPRHEGAARPAATGRAAVGPAIAFFLAVASLTPPAGASAAEGGAAAQAPRASQAAQPSQPPRAEAGKAIRLVAFGDSLTAGYGLPDADGFAPKLEKALRAAGYDVAVINGGVSGDTTTGGLARLDWTLGQGTDAVILELGANDMLRGVDPAVPEKNLAAMIEDLKRRHIRVLLAGMRAAPSLGDDYARRFDAIYPALAKRYDVPLFPFFVGGIIGDPSRHLADGMHPNARGVDAMVADILPDVEALLRGVGEKR